MGVFIGISVGKLDGDKVGFWLGRLLGTLWNTELGNWEVFSLYLSLSPIIVCELGGWFMPSGYGNEMVSHYWCPCCVWIFFRRITFGKQTIVCLVWLRSMLVPWPPWLNINTTPIYIILRDYLVKYEDDYKEGCIDYRTDSCAKSTFFRWNKWERHADNIVIDSLSLLWILV